MSGGLNFVSSTSEFLLSSLFPLQHHLHVLRHSFDGGKTITNVKPIKWILTPYFLSWYLLFIVLQNKSKKRKGTHIREIQAFQKYFQIVYDPLHLKRTINYAAKTLRDKALDKIPTMKFPPFTPNKYLFALHFKMKFPPFPTRKLALAFRPPYPKWLPCDSLLGMRQKLITREKNKVT